MHRFLLRHVAVMQGLDKSVPMKDSGVEWLGEVPAHWDIRRIKDLASLQSGDAITADQIEEIGPYPVYGGNGIRGFFTSYTNEGEHVLIGRQGALCGNINFASGRFWATEHAVVAYLKRNVHTKWFGETLRVMNLNQYSISAAQPGLSMERVKQLLLPVPPYDEQVVIATYLDAKTAQIDRKIDLLTQKAAKYRQLKQAIINAAVTRGLDTSAPMKESGVEWIGEVPAHWVLGRLKDFVLVNPTSRLPQNVSNDALVEFVPMANVDEQLGQIRSFEMVPLRNVASGYKRFQNGDVIFARITPCMENGNCAIVRGLTQWTGFGSTEFQVYRPLKGMIPQYLHYFLHNESFRKNAEPHMKGSAGQKRVPSEYIETHGFVLPPLVEQCSIVAHLNERTATLDRVIAMINAQTSSLGILRKSLINDVVTGKLRVT